MLIVLDNLEHLLDAAPALAEVLQRCPAVKCLCTSRARLGIGGEQVYVLASLALQHGIDLFTQRATATSSTFVVTDENGPDIEELCHHLDGLPLAIELAAARIAVLPPRAMIARLGDRLALLSVGHRDAPDRHRGLREAIAWSYDLLGEPDQRMFRRLGVFVGGFTLDAATAVAGDGEDALAGISSLEASSLLQRTSVDGADVRFGMLETIREYALEQMRLCGSSPQSRQGHADCLVLLTDDTDRIWWEAGGLKKLDELEPEIANIRAALTWMQHVDDVPEVLRLAGSLGSLWASRGYSRKGRTWLEWAWFMPTASRRTSSSSRSGR